MLFRSLGRATLARHPRGARENLLVPRPATLGMPPVRKICTFLHHSGVPLSNLSLPTPAGRPFPLQNPVALDFLDVLSRFSNLVFTYFLILVYKDYFDQSCTELLAGLSPVLWVLRSSKDYKAGGGGGGGRPFENRLWRPRLGYSPGWGWRPSRKSKASKQLSK